MKWWKILLIIIIFTGIFFRVVNLDRKVYWNDEVFTSLRVSGYTEVDIDKQLYDGHLVTVAQLQKYQNPSSEKGLISTFKSIAVEAAQHPPLYFVSLRFWEELWGNSVVVRRSFSVIFSLFNFLAIYWLVKELFKSELAAWIAVGLIAVSPFHVLYAQTARQNSLWASIVLLSNLALLRALRLNTKTSWGIYSLTLATHLYTFGFSWLVVFGQGIYVFLREKLQLKTSIVKNYLLSFFVGLLFYFPWMVIAFFSLRHVSKITSVFSYSFKHGIPELVLTWCRHLTRLFLDFEMNLNFGWENPFPYIIPVFIFTALSIYSVYFVTRHTDREIKLFILIAIAANCLPLMLPDLILGGKRSGITRYLLPAYLAIQMSVAYLLATNFWQKKIWQIITVIIFTLGIISCANSSNAQIWWHNGSGKIGQNPEIAKIINQSSVPVVISDTAWGDVISLSYSLEEKVKFILVTKDVTPEIVSGFSDYFLYKPSAQLSDTLKQKYNYSLEPIYEPKNPWLYKIKVKINSSNNEIQS